MVPHTITILSVLSAMMASSASANADTLSFIQRSNNNNCPGVQLNDNNNIEYCCVGGSLDMQFSTIFDDPSTTSVSISTQASDTSMSCATKIPMTASNYDALVSSASVSYYSSQTAKPTTSSSIAIRVDGSFLYWESVGCAAVLALLRYV